MLSGKMISAYVSDSSSFSNSNLPPPGLHSTLLSTFDVGSVEKDEGKFKFSKIPLPFFIITTEVLTPKMWTKKYHVIH